MTDSLAALRLIAETGMPERDAALADFYAALAARAAGGEQVVRAPGR